MLSIKLWSIFVICFTCKTLAIVQQQKEINYFLQKSNIQVKPFSEENARNGKLAISNLDVFRDVFASFKNLIWLDYNNDRKAAYKYNVQKGRIQRKIPKSTPFPCQLNNTRSAEPPTSVHRLRPGDIDIIAAIGDSLTAGTAIMAKTYVQLFAEFRGHTFLGGGLENWRTSLTLPNILKVFNPNLYGYAVANTLGRYRSARFNVAEAIANTQDMPYMAHVLIKRLQSDPKVDMKKHWKMISLFIGSNDVCSDMCYYDNIEDFLESHRKNLYKTLKILKDNIPRVFVNIVPVPNIENTVRLMNKLPPFCEYIQKVYCHCILSDSFNAQKLRNISKIIESVQKIDQEIPALPEFQTEDFAVMPQTFTVNLALRNLTNGDTDLRYFSGDCFHFSQYGHAALANMVWNNLLQTKDKKDFKFLRPFEKFECPNEERPYIVTFKNSQ